MLSWYVSPWKLSGLLVFETWPPWMRVMQTVLKPSGKSSLDVHHAGQISPCGMAEWCRAGMLGHDTSVRWEFATWPSKASRRQG